jgi:hypothetical protein
MTVLNDNFMTAPASLPMDAPTTMPVEMQVMQRMMGEFLASTALTRVQADINQLASNYQQLQTNIHTLNAGLGDFREKVMVPIRQELEYLRYNLGARVEDNVGMLDKLTKHLTEQIDLVLRAKGVNPSIRDAEGNTVLDRMGIAAKPSSVNPYEPLHPDVIEQMSARLDRLEQENRHLRKLALDAGPKGV